MKVGESTRRRRARGEAATAPVALLQGYDSVSGLGLSTALTGKAKNDRASSDLRYRVCQDLSSLATALDLNQSLSIGFGPVGSVDEKMNFVSNLNVTTHSISIVVYARHGIGTETATDVSLDRTKVEKPVGNAALLEFFLGYGDSYVASCTKGGEYFAVYTFYSQTREEKSQLELDMKAQGIFEVAKVDATLQLKLNSFTSSTKTRLSVTQKIIGIRDPKLPPADKIIEFAEGFSSLPLDAPSVIHFETHGYERVPGFGSFQPIVKNRRFFVGSGVLDGLAASLVRVKQLQNQIRWLQDIHAFYGYDDPRLAQVAAQAKTDLETLDGLINDFEDDPTRSFQAPKLASLDAGTPSLSYATAESPQYGRREGTTFIDVDVVTDLARKTRVASLRIASGTRIDNLRVVYENATGKPQQIDHGGSGGGWSNPLPLRPGQFVTRISGGSGSTGMLLQIDITGGASLRGGQEGGDRGSFDWTVDKGCFVLGFAGRASKDFLEQIACVYCKLEPAKWTKTT